MAACAALAITIWKLRLLTPHGAAGAFLIAVLIWQFRGFKWLLVLLAFFFISAAATRWKYGHKEKAGTAEARKGKRSIENVMGSAYAPLLFVVFDSPVGFLAAVAAAVADNLASEIGVLDKNVRLITTLRKVPPGTDGGVSLLGELVSLLAAAGVAALSPLIGISSAGTILTILLCGFLGSQFDSVLGATIERRGLVGKTEVNVAATLFAGLLAVVLMNWGVDLYIEQLLTI